MIPNSISKHPLSWGHKLLHFWNIIEERGQFYSHGFTRIYIYQITTACTPLFDSSKKLQLLWARLKIMPQEIGPLMLNECLSVTLSSHLFNCKLQKTKCWQIVWGHVCEMLHMRQLSLTLACSQMLTTLQKQCPLFCSRFFSCSISNKSRFWLRFEKNLIYHLVMTKWKETCFFVRRQLCTSKSQKCWPWAVLRSVGLWAPTLAVATPTLLQKTTPGI